MYRSVFWYSWRLKRRMRRVAVLAIRAGLVASLLLVSLSLLPWIWPEAGEKVRRFFAPIENMVRPITERVAHRLGVEWQALQARSGATGNGVRTGTPRADKQIRVFRGAETLSGSASAIDGDTLELNGVRVRLHGVDAPENDQPCRTAGRRWPCGREARRALAARIHGGRVACEVRDQDSYGRVVATCSVAGQDLNAWMVANGWALAYRRYSLAYVGEESRARATRRGVWQGEFVAPWKWREAQRR